MKICDKKNRQYSYVVRDYVEGKTLETIAEMYGAQPALVR